MNLKSESKKLTPSIIIPNKIKYFGKFIQFVSVSLAVKFADKLFTTPIKFSVPDREKTMYKSSQKHRLYVSNIDRTIDVLVYGYSDKKVLLVHGWAGRSTQLFMVADKLLERGFMVVSFDAPAHGKSTGKTSNMLEYIESIYQIEKEFGSFVGAIGHSMGGMVLFNSVSEKLSIKVLVSIGAADTISEIINRFVFNLGLKPIVAEKLKSKYDKKWNTDVDLHSSSVKVKEILIPTLIVHDTQDGDVAVNCAKNIHKNLKNGYLLITEGLGHTKILRNEEVMDKVVDFIIKYTNE